MLFRYMLVSMFFISVMQAKSLVYELPKQIHTALQPSTQKHRIEDTTGYAQYRVAFYVTTQKDKDLLATKQKEIMQIVDSVVKNYNAAILQAVNERKIVEREITKEMNKNFGDNFIQATHIVTMVILPDMNYNP